MSGLQDISLQVLRDLFGTRTLSNCGLAIHGSNTENALTAKAMDFVILGKAYTAAANTEIDISADVTVPAALADLYTQVGVLGIAADGTLELSVGTAYLTADIAAGTKLLDIPNPPAASAAFGVIKVVNASGADFTWGTTALDATGITATFTSVGHVPIGADL